MRDKRIRLTVLFLALAWAVGAPLFLTAREWGEGGDLERKFRALIVSQTPSPDEGIKRTLLGLVDEEGRRRERAIDFVWISSAVILGFSAVCIWRGISERTQA